ncbi:aromatic compound dioxygenase [Russula dissimulans]|nr:aromatic compound dioxygenase [Russula dissimulans]
MSPTEVHAAVSNGISAPDLDLPYPDRPEVITANVLKLTELIPNPRSRFIFKSLISKLHEFVAETNVTTEEWMNTIDFLTRTGQTCTPIRQEFILLSDVLGVSALVDALNNPSVGNATESTVLGPFFTEDAPDVPLGESIASEGRGRVLDSSGKPVPGAVIETWETDDKGFYDTQYAERHVPDCRGRLRTDAEGNFGYRAVVPIAYPIPGDGPVGQLLLKLGRHNIRPNHLHVMVDAPGFHKLTTSLYPEGDIFLSSDAVFGVKRSLVVKLTDVDDEAEARKRGFKNGTKFKLLKHDFIILTEEESAAARAQRVVSSSA